FEDIAKIRGRQLSTVINAVANLVETGALEFNPKWIDPARRSIIEAACAKCGLEWLKPVKESLPPEITYDEIRLVVAHLRCEKTVKSEKKTTIPPDANKTGQKLCHPERREIIRVLRE